MPHAELVEDRIVVQTLWNEKEQIKRIPGARWNSTTKAWTLSPSWASCVQLRYMFPTITYGDGLRALIVAHRRDRVEPSLLLRELSETDRDVGKLYPFQRIGVDWLHVAGSALLADEMARVRRSRY